MDAIRMTALRDLRSGMNFPYDGGEVAGPPDDWAHVAARGVMANLLDRRGIKGELSLIDQDVRAEIVQSLSEIIRQSRKYEHD
jgi:hypothetical protein